MSLWLVTCVSVTYLFPHSGDTLVFALKHIGPDPGLGLGLTRGAIFHVLRDWISTSCLQSGFQRQELGNSFNQTSEVSGLSRHHQVCPDTHRAMEWSALPLAGSSKSSNALFGIGWVDKLSIHQSHWLLCRWSRSPGNEQRSDQHSHVLPEHHGNLTDMERTVLQTPRGITTR
jgi:hypothetical protein